MLAAGRVAQWLDGESARVWPGVIGIVATIAVLAHLADDWSAGSAAVRNGSILLAHAALLAAIAVGGLDRRAGSRPPRRAAPREAKSRANPPGVQLAP